MVYIHVKKVGNKRFYTLRISLRDENGRVITKDLENLGNDLNKIKIDDLEKKYKDEIRKSYKTLKRFLDSERYLEKAKTKKLKKNPYLSKEQNDKIEAIRLHYHEFLKENKKTKQEIYEFFLIKFAVSSTSIEGNTINLREAEKLLKRNITPKNKTLREIYDLQNTERVFFEILEKPSIISLKSIENIHDKLLDKIDSRKGYRTHDIRIFGQPFSPSPARYVKSDMKLLIDWYGKNKKKIHPLVFGALFHHKFENIHPFSDGNGRTGRILINSILLEHKYPPIIIPKTKREEYLETMNKADLAIKNNILNVDSEHYRGLLNFIFREYEKSYWNTFLI